MAASFYPLSIVEAGLVLDALRARRDQIDAFLYDADSCDELDAVREDLEDTRVLAEKLSAFLKAQGIALPPGA